jgi:protocatechuate 3,4-dioxygenase beta subunit
MPTTDMHHTPPDHDDFGGLQRDLPGLLGRRSALKLFAGVGLLTLVGCSSDSKSATSSEGATRDTSGATGETSATASTDSTLAAAVSQATTGDCAQIPTETGGPFPGDGTNGPNVLTESDVVRSDIRTSIGAASGTAEGVPLKITFQLTSTATNCSALAGAAVYAWHCDRGGNYSMYSDAAASENYLRGVQVSDASGSLTFQSIFPAAYSGRWPHVHFEVYENVAAATSGGTPILTSQLAIPEDTCNLVYATAGYEASAANMTQTPLASDGVFGDDGAVHELGFVTGTIADGLTVTLPVAV